MAMPQLSITFILVTTFHSYNASGLFDIVQKWVVCMQCKGIKVLAMPEAVWPEHRWMELTIFCGFSFPSNESERLHWAVWCSDDLSYLCVQESLTTLTLQECSTPLHGCRAPVCSCGSSDGSVITGCLTVQMHLLGQHLDALRRWWSGSFWAFFSSQGRWETLCSYWDKMKVWAPNHLKYTIPNSKCAHPCPCCSQQCFLHS